MKMPCVPVPATGPGHRDECHRAYVLAVREAERHQDVFAAIVGQPHDLLVLTTQGKRRFLRRWEKLRCRGGSGNEGQKRQRGR